MKLIWITLCVSISDVSLCLAQAKIGEPGKSQPPAADPMVDENSGQVREDNGLKMKLVWCPPGIFTMEQRKVIEQPPPMDTNTVNESDDDEVVDEPAPTPLATTSVSPVRVFLKYGYWLGKYEVTQSEWKQVMNTEPWKGRRYMQEGADYPATYIRWNDATDFCQKLTLKERQAGRLPYGWEYALPTEAQWERACRARTDTRFSFGNDDANLRDYAWFSGNFGPDRAKNGGHYAQRVGQLKANPWGFYDMHGNVWEWCRDRYSENLPGGRDPEVRHQEETPGSGRVIRGGSWISLPDNCRSAFRCEDSPNIPFTSLGLRVCLTRLQ